MATYKHKLPQDFAPRWFCPKCGAMHETEQAARKCDASDKPFTHEVGEIVSIDIAYGWFDGDVEWMQLNTDTFHGKPTHSAFFVVTAIDYERRGYQPHEPRYHVKTLGIKNGNPTGLIGWTRDATHKRMIPVDQGTPLAQKLRAQGAQYIGETTEALL